MNAVPMSLASSLQENKAFLFALAFLCDYSELPKDKEGLAKEKRKKMHFVFYYKDLSSMTSLLPAFHVGFKMCLQHFSSRLSKNNVGKNKRSEVKDDNRRRLLEYKKQIKHQQAILRCLSVKFDGSTSNVKLEHSSKGNETFSNGKAYGE